MKTRTMKQAGFSLTEVLIATGILAMGLVMIAMAFPVGVKLASIATERPVGVVAANEALCKMRLYGIQGFTDPNTNWPTNLDTTCTDYWQVCATLLPLSGQDDQRCYPSLVPQPPEIRYYWSALVRRADSNTGEIQATVFICRMLGMSSTYYDMDHTLSTPKPNNDNPWPVPVKIRVGMTALAREIQIVIPSPLIYPPSGTEYRFFTEGCRIVEDSKGTIYKVMEMKDNSSPLDGIRETLVLDKAFAGAALPYVWVVPPAVGSGRNPCIDVVQTVLTIK